MKKISKSRNRDCAAMVMSGIAAVLFLCQPGDYRHPMVVMLLSGIVVAGNTVYLFFRDPYRLLPMAASAVNLSCLVVVIASQLNNIAMLATGVGLGNSHIPAVFPVCTICYLLAIVLNAWNVFTKDIDA